VDDQHPSSTTTDNELFKDFVGRSDQAEQQKILEFFNKVLDLGVNFKSQPQVRRKKLGYLVPSAYTTVTEIEGVLTVGGCLSNSYGLMVARESLFPGSGLTGLPAVASKIRVLIPDVIEHYSIRSAMAWLGMGEANVVRVPVDDVHRMIPGPLELHLDEERAVGNRILACIAYAGDSRGMRIDNLDQVGNILRKIQGSIPC
jgi:L-2,4-diaminobutyrate decarboxylase